MLKVDEIHIKERRENDITERLTGSGINLKEEYSVPGENNEVNKILGLEGGKLRESLLVSFHLLS